MVTLTEMPMPFGKFLGTPVSALPLEYLAWVRSEVQLREPLKTAVELAYRDHIAPAARFDVDAWYRKLATEFHPDRRGGSCEAMKAVRRAREVAEEMLRGAR